MAPLMAGQMPVVVVPGGEFAVGATTGAMPGRAYLATSAAFANIAASVISSSLPSPRGAPGHSGRPRRSRPDPSLGQLLFQPG